MITVVYGKPGTGKTRNAKRLQRHFGCRRVHDFGRFAALDQWQPERVAEMKLRDGDLVLTSALPSMILRRLSGQSVRVVEITRALAQLGQGQGGAA